ANLDPCFQDITARKAAERRLQQREQWYRDLLGALPAALYTTDADGRITFFNRGRRRALRQAAFPRRRCLVDWQQALLARREAHRAGGMSHGARPQDWQAGARNREDRRASRWHAHSGHPVSDSVAR